MDSRTYHRGSSNTAQKARPVYYFSFAAETGRLPEGPSYSVRKLLAGLTLSDFMQGRALEMTKQMKQHVQETNWYLQEELEQAKKAAAAAAELAAHDISKLRASFDEL